MTVVANRLASRAGSEKMGQETDQEMGPAGADHLEVVQEMRAAMIDPSVGIVPTEATAHHAGRVPTSPVDLAKVVLQEVDQAAVAPPEVADPPEGLRARAQLENNGA